MANTQPPSSNNLYIGRGVVYFDRFTDSTTTKTGELCLGNVESMSITVEAERKEKYSSMSSTSDLYHTCNIRNKWKVKLVGNEVYSKIMAIIGMGNTTTVSQTGSTVTGETLVTSASVQGCWYPTVYRKISAYTVKVGGSAKAETTDYTVDAVRGRIYIVPGGGISDGSTVTIDYTYASISLTGVQMGTKSTVEGFLRFIGDSATGPDIEVQVWHVSVNPSKVFEAITGDYAQWELELDAYEEKAAHPTEPVWRMIYDAS